MHLVSHLKTVLLDFHAGWVMWILSLGKSDASGIPGGIAPQAIMTGVSEALVATAIGLLVAIPSVVAFNFFSRRINESLANGEALSDLLLAHLSAEAPALPPDSASSERRPQQ
ncbi:MAG: MotA/TolQ/ExbB proton channel family protein [Acidimicrobiales bacterium]